MQTPDVTQAPRRRHLRALLLGVVVVALTALLLLGPDCRTEPLPDHAEQLVDALADRADRGSLARRTAWWKGTRRLRRGRATPCELAASDGPWRDSLSRAGWRPLLEDDFGDHEDVPWEPGVGVPDPDEPDWLPLWRGCAGPCGEAEGIRPTGEGLSLRPAPPDHDGVTRSTFVASAAETGPMLLSASLRTDAQLRDEPNPWETAWLFWRLGATDDDRSRAADPAGLCSQRRGLYLALKTNGWELGKFGPGYSSGLAADPQAGGCQRFMASGDSPKARPGRWQRVCVLALEDRVAAWVDGELLVGAGTWRDRDDRLERGGRPEGEPVHLSGGVGLYTEDAAVSFTDVVLFGEL